jgi:hypothetical protein
MPPPRWFAVGSANLSEPNPGTRAAAKALVHDDPRLVIVFCSQSHELGPLLAQINARSGHVPLIGCTTAGEITTSGHAGASIVVAALGGEGFVIDTAAATEVSKDLRGAGASAARCLPSPADHPYRSLLMLTDGLAGDQQEIVRGAYAVLGAGVPVVGGCAGADVTMARSFQLHGDRILTNAIVAAGIASDAPLGIGVRHGWRPVGEAMLVTSSHANRVSTIDERPALDVYLERLHVREPWSMNEERLAELALTHPLGLGCQNGEGQVRFISGADFTARSLSCMAEVPQGALLWVMHGDADSVLRATEAACTASLASLRGHPPLGVLAFDCVGRRRVLGEEGIKTEVDRLTASADGAPIAGFYTYGEIARTRGMRGFHNQTLVVLSIA